MTYENFGSPTTNPPTLNPSEIRKMLSKTLIAKLATVDPTGSIPIVAMWFIQEGEHLFIPTS